MGVFAAWQIYNAIEFSWKGVFLTIFMINAAWKSCPNMYSYGFDLEV